MFTYWWEKCTQHCVAVIFCEQYCKKSNL
jgi:hypothetical protein